MEAGDDDPTPVRGRRFRYQDEPYPAEPLMMVPPSVWRSILDTQRAQAAEIRLLHKRMLALLFLVATMAGGASGLFDTMVEVFSGR